MDDIERLIRTTWLRLSQSLSPADLHRRLARRNSALLRRPPRAWCLALRASDTRLTPFQTSLPDWNTPNAVALEAPDLKKLCAPVRLEPPGQTLDQVAALLGVSRCGLRYARLKGVFQTRHIPAHRGQWGRPRPLLYCNHDLDPAAPLFRPPDPGWSWTARFLIARLPDDLHVTLIRVPVISSRTRDLDPSLLHPEHPKLDPPPRKKSPRLPPPNPDPVSYKWDGNRFIGYDWRSTNPHIRIGFDKNERRRQLNREAEARRRKNNPRPSTSQGSLRSWGWRWLCPLCNKPVNMLFYPLPPLTLFNHPLHPSQSPLVPAADHPFLSNFACQKCHQIEYPLSNNPIGWNQIISYLSTGLLYGHEVKNPFLYLAPGEYTRGARSPSSPSPRTPGEGRVRALPKPPAPATSPQASLNHQPSIGNRKSKYVPRPNRSPSKRRPQIENLLLKGIRPRQIAQLLGTSPSYINNQTRIIYKQHNVRSLAQFAQKHNITFPPTDRPRQPNGRILPNSTANHQKLSQRTPVTK